MNFDVKTILQELKRLKDKPTPELIFDWAIINAWANKLRKSKEEPLFIKKKFGSVDNFIRYATALYTELKRRKVGVKLKPHISEYVNENSALIVDLYTTADEIKQACVVEKDVAEGVDEQNDNDDNTKDKTGVPIGVFTLLDDLPNYVLKRGFIRLVGSTVTGNDTEDSDVDIFIDMPADEVPTWVHKKLHLMLSKYFNKPVQIIYQDPDINGPTEDAIVLYDLVLVKRIQYEPAYLESVEYQYELSKDISRRSVKKALKAFKTIYGLDNVSKKDIPFDNYIIQPKYNGMQVIITDSGKTVYSKNYNKLPIELTHIFTEETPYIFIGEIWSDVLPRQTVIGKVKKGELDGELNITIHDMLYPDEDYRTILQLIKKYVKSDYVVKNFTDLTDAIRYVKEHPEYDGVVIKDLDATIEDTKRMIKVKKEADIDVQVIRRYKNKNDTYKYEVGYLNPDNELVSFGETFSTKSKFEPGDIIEVSCGEINYYEKDGVIKGYAIRVKGASANDKPYTHSKILKIGKDCGILNHITEE